MGKFVGWVGLGYLFCIGWGWYWIGVPFEMIPIVLLLAGIVGYGTYLGFTTTDLLG